MTLHWRDDRTREVVFREVLFNPWAHAHHAMEGMESKGRIDDAAVVESIAKQMVETLVHVLAHHLPEAGPKHGEDHGKSFMDRKKERPKGPPSEIMYHLSTPDEKGERVCVLIKLDKEGRPLPGQEEEMKKLQ